jgi:hypothetical protein
MKKNMKSWISLFVVAGLVTGCGAMKKSSSDSQKKSVQTSTTVKAYPSMSLNNLAVDTSDWLSLTGEHYEALGMISRQDANSLIGTNSDNLILIGTLSLTRTKKKYNDLYDGTSFLPDFVKNNENYPEISVFLGQNGTDKIAVLVKAIEYANIADQVRKKTVQYAKQNVCIQWNTKTFNAAPSTLNCPNAGAAAITCTSYGNCHSNYQCVMTTPMMGLSMSLPFEPMGKIPEPLPSAANCELSDVWPTQSTTVEEVSKISEIRIHPTNADQLKTSEIIFPGEQF